MIWFVILLQILDGWTTQRVLKKGGFEKNPVVAKLIEQFGVAGLWGAKALGVAFAVALELSTVAWADMALVGVAALYSYIVYNNWKIG